ncbi:inhibitory synaptic factor 1 isoform X1 [Equus asinus]|uniref:Inhibitory synaptic factor 1 n=3 Tax=Equus asinus TaxID=9793 RepID=A0A8C4L7D6_EQUAS
MNIRGTPDLGQPSDDPSSGGERERIRQRMKMVIGQLEGILRELKEVAKELREEGKALRCEDKSCKTAREQHRMLEEGARPAERKGLAVTPSAILLLCLLLPFPSPRHRCSWQTLLILLSAQPKIHRKVVSQIDKLTSDFDFELEPDDWTTATVSSTSSSDKAGVGGPFDLGHLDFMTADILSDSWEFCSFLDVSTPSDSVDGPESARPGAGPDYRLMNGSLPIPNGPRVETPDSSSEEAFSAGPAKGQLPQRTPGTRERVRFSDKVLYHALCCDDEGDGEEEAAEEEADLSPEPPRTEAPAGPPKPAPAPYKPRRSPLTSHRSGPTVAPEQTRRVTRNSSTQTVSDKSTQTALPYTATRRKARGKN